MSSGDVRNTRVWTMGRQLGSLNMSELELTLEKFKYKSKHRDYVKDCHRIRKRAYADVKKGMKLNDILKKYKRKRNWLYSVICEYGGPEEGSKRKDWSE
jgi:hypothetical protein